MSILVLLDVEPYVPAPTPPVAILIVIVSLLLWLVVKSPPVVKFVPAFIVIVALFTVGIVLLEADVMCPVAFTAIVAAV